MTTLIAVAILGIAVQLIAQRAMRPELQWYKRRNWRVPRGTR